MQIYAPKGMPPALLLASLLVLRFFQTRFAVSLPWLSLLKQSERAMAPFPNCGRMPPLRMIDRSVKSICCVNNQGS